MICTGPLSIENLEVSFPENRSVIDRSQKYNIKLVRKRRENLAIYSSLDFSFGEEKFISEESILEENWSEHDHIYLSVCISPTKAKVGSEYHLLTSRLRETLISLATNLIHGDSSFSVNYKLKVIKETLTQLLENELQSKVN